MDNFELTDTIQFYFECLQNSREALRRRKSEGKLKPEKTNIDIWKERSVGEKFDQAFERYFE
ncbi:hypothetical protein NQ317_015527 [Molorchus minor]|uniref:Uncharacterized protein n=1 Tax=Molorchus minor TaxID=1323400 RepID=A0ABQ9JN13_9CUCU|nr:hypothetical protein NQ317_015527 [Molorchus minor]